MTTRDAACRLLRYATAHGWDVDTPAELTALADGLRDSDLPVPRRLYRAARAWMRAGKMARENCFARAQGNKMAAP